LPEVPDTVVLAVNPLRAAPFTREAAAAGVPAVVIPGGGVVEGGEAAARMQAEVAEIARATGTAILGPNCMGLIDLTTGCATYIDEIHPFIRRGGVAAIAQSGSVADAFMHAGTRIGWSRIVSCGSEVVLDLCDYLAYCLDDPSTDAVVLDLVDEPTGLAALAERLPLMATDPGCQGRPQRQAQAAVAHTGVAGEHRVTQAALRARCDRCDDLDEPWRPPPGHRRHRSRHVGRGRTAVVTVSTGEGSLIADLATDRHRPARCPDDARARIAAALPSLGYIGNPMDPWGADEATPAYRACFEAFTGSGAYDVLALVHDFPFRSQAGELSLALELAGELATATADHPGVLPVFVSLTSGDASPELQEALDAAGGIPIVRGTVPAFAAIARLAWWEARQ
jgi:acyl-CoA synthetase (NDP forming)